MKTVATIAELRATLDARAGRGAHGRVRADHGLPARRPRLADAGGPGRDRRRGGLGLRQPAAVRRGRGPRRLPPRPRPRHRPWRRRRRRRAVRAVGRGDVPRDRCSRPCRWPRCRPRSRARPGPPTSPGVATVVAKLFSIVGPCRAYFGAKDFQQVAVVRRMAADLSLPVEVVACPTLREPDGLAMSSPQRLPDARPSGPRRRSSTPRCAAARRPSGRASATPPRSAT